MNPSQLTQQFCLPCLQAYAEPVYPKASIVLQSIKGYSSRIGFHADLRSCFYPGCNLIHYFTYKPAINNGGSSPTDEYCLVNKIVPFLICMKLPEKRFCILRRIIFPARVGIKIAVQALAPAERYMDVQTHFLHLLTLF